MLHKIKITKYLRVHPMLRENKVGKQYLLWSCGEKLQN